MKDKAEGSRLIGRRGVMSLSLGALTWSIAAHAQPLGRMPLIGFLTSLLDDASADQQSKEFERELSQLGWVSGKNAQVVYRFAGGDLDKMKVYANELIRMSPDVLVSVSTPATADLQALTGSIPIVFYSLTDPVGVGLVESLAKPGGHTTGFTLFEFSMVGKWMELLKEVAPDITRVCILFYPPAAPYAPKYIELAGPAAASFGLELTLARITGVSDIETVVAGLADGHTGFVVLPDAFTTSNPQRKILVSSLIQHRLPAVFSFDFFGPDGALICYSGDIVEQAGQTATYVDRILRGAKAADLPVQGPTKFNLVLNQKTAAELGLFFPPLLLAEASQIIE